MSMVNRNIRDTLAADVAIKPPDNHAETGDDDLSTLDQSQKVESDLLVVHATSKAELARKYQDDVDEDPGMFDKGLWLSTKLGLRD